MKSTPKHSPAARDRSPRNGAIASAYARVMRIRGEPREITLGLALGVMVGMTPFLGFHTVIALFLATLLKWSRITAPPASSSLTR